MYQALFADGLGVGLVMHFAKVEERQAIDWLNNRACYLLDADELYEDYTRDIEDGFDGDFSAWVEAQERAHFLYTDTRGGLVVIALSVSA